ncbi:MAG: DUF2341 domain-containing protein [Candidatus Thorarchaeota archaeon]
MKLCRKVVFHVLLLILILNIAAISTNGFFDFGNIGQQEPQLRKTSITSNSGVKRTNKTLISPKPRDITRNSPSEEEKDSRFAAEIDSRSLKDEKTGSTLLGGSVTSWANTSFHYRKNFTIDHNKVSADLTGFPVLISTGPDPDLGTGKVQVDGNDIIFTNASGARLPHEIEAFQQVSSLGLLLAWVKVPTLSSTTDTVLSMYYGNDTLPSQENATGVWDSGFAGVWHLAENPFIYHMKDSTANNNAGTTHGTITSANRATGQVGYGFRFNGLNNFIDVGNSAVLQITGDLTVETWFYTDSVANDDLVMKTQENGGGRGWGLNITDDGGAIAPDGYAGFHFASGTSGGNFYTTSFGWGAGTNRVNASRWNHLVAVFKPSTYGRFYINGQMVDEDTASIPSSIYNTLANVTFGCKSGNINLKFFTGTLDEIRISNVTRSTAWISTQYNNTNNPASFYTIGSEDVYDATDPIVDAFGVDDDGTGHPRFWAEVSDPFGTVDTVTIDYDGTEYPMSLNSTGYWTYTPATVTFAATVSYQIANASDIYGNYLAQTTTTENHVLDYDIVAPSIGTNDWYHDPDIGQYGTTSANATDAWGVIDTVIVNVTFAGGIPRNNLTAIMRPTASGYINDTLKMDRGIIYVEFIANDTAGNFITLGPFFGFAGPNDPPIASNVAFAPSLVRSNESLQLSYDYSDIDDDVEAGTQIRWYKNGELQSDYNDFLIIPAAALIKGDQWNATVTPKDGRDFGVPTWSPTITVQNVAPEVLALDFANHTYAAFLVEDEDLNVSYTFSDNDNDPDASIIHWYINGVYNATYDNKTLIPANQTRPAEVWSFEILPFDGTDYGSLIKSQEMTIESRPKIDDYWISPQKDMEGHYEFWVHVSDPRNPVNEVQFQIFSKTDWAEPSEEGYFVYDYNFDLIHLNSNITINCTAISTVQSSSDEIRTTLTFNMTFTDQVPPRVLDVKYFWDEEDPVNITFIAEIGENGSEIVQVILYYYFRPVGSTVMPNAPALSQAPNSRQLLEGRLHNVGQNGDSYAEVIMIQLNDTHWIAEVPFAPDGDTEILYFFYVEDSAGNFNRRAREETGTKQFLLKGGGGLDLMFVLGLLAIVALLFAIGSVVAIKKWRTTELVGLDKDRVLGTMGIIEEDQVKDTLASHTLGVVVSFFDQRHGPIPIIIVPEILRDNYDKLVDLSDQSFSVCQFMDNFEREKFAIFDFTLEPTLSVNSISFAFALERPKARGGSENITLNILVQPNVFPLVSQFVDHFSQKVHEIHAVMDKSPSRRDTLLEMIIDLRMQISYIILSYERLYGTTELLLEEDGT